MMRKRRIFFIAIGFASFIVQAGCAKKISSVSGAAVLHAERERRVEDKLSPLDEEEVGKDEIAFTPDEAAAEMRESTIKEEEITSKQMLAQPDAGEITAGLVDVYFDYDKASLKSDSKVVLQENARNLLLRPSVRIQITGHTDERGSSEYNLALGARRARAVKRFLEALGVSPHRMKIISYGEESPFCKKSQESCWQLNRRVHFVAQPKE